MKRRQFLKNTAMTGTGAFVASMLPQSLLAQAASSSRSVVVLFMRGAWDGFNIMPPRSGADRTAYDKVRPTLGIKTDKIQSLGSGYTYGMHPALVNMKALFDAGQLAILPRAGSLNPTRSHFEQMDYIEAGTTVKGAEFGASGYLSRVYKLNSVKAKHWAISLGPTLASSLKTGATGLALPLAFADLNDFGKLKNTRTVASKQVIDKLKLYQLHPDSASCSVKDGQNVIDYQICSYANQAGSMVADLSRYPGDAGRAVSAQLLQACTLIKEEGVRFITVDMSGWDTHFNQVDGTDSSIGAQANLLKSLDNAINGFVTRAKAKGIWNTTTLVIMSEFGRTVFQNGTRGTDHGRGGVAFVLGGAVKGKLNTSLATNANYKYRFNWEVSASEATEGTSNALEVHPQTDLRHVMARVLAHSLGLPYSDVAAQFTGDPLPTADYLRLFG